MAVRQIAMMGNETWCGTIYSFYHATSRHELLLDLTSILKLCYFVIFEEITKKKKNIPILLKLEYYY